MVGIALGLMAGGVSAYLVATATAQPQLDSLQAQLAQAKAELAQTRKGLDSAREAQARAESSQRQVQSLQADLNKADAALTSARGTLKVAQKELTCCFDIATASIYNFVDIKPYTGKLYDAHHSYLGPEFASLDDYPKALDAAGIDKVVLLWGPGAAPLPPAVAGRYPDRFIPFSTWSFAVRDYPAVYRPIAEVRQELTSRVFRGIGEVITRGDSTVKGEPGPLTANVPPDDQRLLEVMDMAAELQSPIMVSAGQVFSDELEHMVAHNPRTPVIWSHAGEPRDQYPVLGHTTTSKIEQLLVKYPNLYIDLSGGLLLLPPSAPDSLVNPDGTVREAWKVLFQQFPGRFVAGVDVGPDPAQVKKAVTYIRFVLGQLPPVVAEAIAYKNIEVIIPK